MPIVFSTYVEMILLDILFLGRYCSILHVCGDDPNLFNAIIEDGYVFSTYVEMILIL